VKDGKGTAAGVSAHAHLLNDAATQIVALFPKGTSRGDFDDKTTRALPKIWEDWDGFKKAADAQPDYLLIDDAVPFWADGGVCARGL